MTVFEPSEARIKVAAMMEDYPGAITPEKAEELIAELEVEFAKIDAEEADGKPTVLFAVPTGRAE
mgnify:CR=1 FL=1